jgi:phosphotransferase system HPr (HPr) family protein
MKGERIQPVPATREEAVPARARRPAAGERTTMKAEPQRRNVVIRNPNGLHIRPAAALVEAARRFQSQVAILRGDLRVDAKRGIMDLFMLGAEEGTELTLEATGPDADEALDVLAEILAGPGSPPEDDRPLPKKG